MTKTIEADFVLKAAEPLVHQHAAEIQPYGHIVRMPIALSENVCKESVENLNQLLADTMTLRDLYKKHDWQLAGPTFYQLHLLFDKHYSEQNELVDAIGAPRGEWRRRWIQRSDRERCHSTQRVAGMVRGRACGEHAFDARQVTDAGSEVRYGRDFHE